MAEIKDKKKFHIFSAAYIGSTVKTGEYGGKKEIAFIGRSNVGKSSLINCMADVKAKVADYPFTTLVPNL